MKKIIILILIIVINQKSISAQLNLSKANLATLVNASSSSISSAAVQSNQVVPDIQMVTPNAPVTISYDTPGTCLWEHWAIRTTAFQYHNMSWEDQLAARNSSNLLFRDFQMHSPPMSVPLSFFYGKFANILIGGAIRDNDYVVFGALRPIVRTLKINN